MRPRILLLGLALATVLGATSIGEVSGHDPKQHRFDMVVFEPPFPAPEFSLATLSGDDARLSDYRGRHVLINFWATWCPPCVREMPALQALYERLGDDRFVVLGISSDAEGEVAVRPFVEKLGLTFPILLDRDAAVSGVYGARSLPASFLLDRRGRVVAAALGERAWASGESFSYFNELMASPR